MGGSSGKTYASGVTGRGVFEMGGTIVLSGEWHGRWTCVVLQQGADTFEWTCGPWGFHAPCMFPGSLACADVMRAACECHIACHPCAAFDRPMTAAGARLGRSAARQPVAHRNRALARLHADLLGPLSPGQSIQRRRLGRFFGGARSGTGMGQRVHYQDNAVAESFSSC